MSASTSEYVTLVSNDGFEFVIRRESAYVAGTIKRMLDPKSTLFLGIFDEPLVEYMGLMKVFDDR